MRKYILIVLLICGCTISVHKKERALREDEVPQSVREAFLKRHPDVHTNFHIQTVDEQNTYEIHFQNDDSDFSERYDEKGELVETEQEISFDEIPEAKQSLIKSWLSDHKAYQVLKSQKVDSKVFKGYEIKTKSKESKTGLLEVYFDYSGHFHHSEEVELNSIPTLN